jgi:hypothetical protein
MNHHDRQLHTFDVLFLRISLSVIAQLLISNLWPARLSSPQKLAVTCLKRFFARWILQISELISFIGSILWFELSAINPTWARRPSGHFRDEFQPPVNGSNSEGG